MYNDYNNYSGQDALQEDFSGYLTRTFRWMFMGLLLTFAVAFVGYATGMVALVLNPVALVLFSIAELAVVIFLGARLADMAPGTATALYFVYAALNGMVFSAYFLIFDLGTLIFAFMAAALYFGVMAVYGAVTKTDLSGLGSILRGGLIALILFSVLGLFFNFGMFDLLICAGGLVLFMVLTAYDVQKIRALYYNFAGDEYLAHKASIYAALQLYLDFINIFLKILRLMSCNRD